MLIRAMSHSRISPAKVSATTLLVFPSEHALPFFLQLDSKSFSSYFIHLLYSFFLNFFLSSCILLQAARNNQAVPSTLCLEIPSAKYLCSSPSSSTFPQWQDTIQPSFLPIYSKSCLSKGMSEITFFISIWDLTRRTFAFMFLLTFSSRQSRLIPLCISKFFQTLSIYPILKPLLHFLGIFYRGTSLPSTKIYIIFHGCLTNHH